MGHNQMFNFQYFDSQFSSLTSYWGPRFGLLNTQTSEQPVYILRITRYFPKYNFSKWWALRFSRISLQLSI